MAKTETAMNTPDVEKWKAKGFSGEMKELYIFKDSDKYQNDVYMDINGHNIVIKRGVNVMVPIEFWELWRNSQEQDTKTADLINAKHDDYRKIEKDLI